MRTLSIVLLPFKGIYRGIALSRTARLKRARRILSIGSHYLQEYGWYVELDGKRVAALHLQTYNSDAYEYTLRVLTRDAEIAKKILDQSFWDQHATWMGTKLWLRSRLTGEAAPSTWRHGRFALDTKGVTRFWIRALVVSLPRRTIFDICSLRHKANKYKT